MDEGKESDRASASLFDEKEYEHAYITHIRATNVVSGLRRHPSGYYVAVEVNGKTRTSSNNPALAGKDVVEWDEEILLPSERSSVILFKIYASFELGLRTGKRLLCQFRVTVGDVLDDSQQPLPIRNTGKEVLSSCPQLRITAQRRMCGAVKSTTTLDLLDSKTLSQVAKLSDNGHCAFMRYCQLRDPKDLDEAIMCFKLARDMCPPNHPYHCDVLFNLATATFTRCQDNDLYTDLHVPIILYQDALQICTSNYADHSVTALDLCFALLARLQRQGNETNGSMAKDLLGGMVKSRAYRAAWFALQMAGISVSIRAPQSPISRTNRSGLDEWLMQNARAYLTRSSNRDPHRRLFLAAIGALLCGRFESSGNLVEINEGISVLENAVELTYDEDPDKPEILGALGSALSLRFSHLDNHADVSKSIMILQEALRLTPDGHPNKATWLNSLGKSLACRFQHLGDLKDINKSISTQEQALDLTPNGHPDRLGRLNDLGISFYRRFGRFGRLEDISKSISILEEIVSTGSNNHANMPIWLSNLGNSLLCRFEYLGHPADMNKSISVLEEALCLAPNGHSGKPAVLTNLGLSLMHRFWRLGDLADIDKSILMLKEALRLTPNGHPDKPTQLNDLGLSLSCRFERLNDLMDINASILAIEEAIYLTPNGHPDKLARLINLGDSLSCRFGRLGDLADLNKSILMQEEAVRLTPYDHHDRPSWLSHLGSSLSTRFERLGDFTDIDRSILLKEEALCLTRDDYHNKPARLSGLGKSLTCRFERLGDLADLDKSISLEEEALRLTANDHSNKPTLLSHLGVSLLFRFQRLGDLSDINRSISMQEEALRLTSDGNPDKPTRLSNLGTSLSNRFEHLGDLADLNRSISLTQEALRLAPKGHSSKPAWLNHLGNSLLFRFERFSDLADIDISISVLEEAVCLTPDDHPDKPIWSNNLGNSLVRRFEHLNKVADINKAVLIHEEAVQLTPDGDSGKAARLDNLGLSFLRRYECLGDLADLNRSVSAQEEAIQLTPDDHPDKPAWLRNFGNTLMYCFENFHDPSSLSTAILHFSAAARTSVGPTYIRFRAARSWTLSAQLEGDSQALLDAYTITLNLLPELAWLGLPLTERHRVLTEAADVARDAAATALEAGHPEMAIEWLEQGRSIVWSQFLQLRTSVDELHAAHPALARQFQQISRELERVSSCESGTSHALANNLTANTGSFGKAIRRHHDFAVKWKKLLAEIRSLAGFERFLLPKSIEQLTTLAHSGPVIYLNASKHRCDALIIIPSPGNVVPVPLSGTTFREIKFMQSLLHLVLKRNRLMVSRNDISSLISPEEGLTSSQLLSRLLQRDGMQRSERAARVKPQQTEGYDPDEVLQEILADLWEGVVNPVLRALGLSTPQSGTEKLTHIFWCPTGPFTFLPIHAAGIYSSSKPGERLSDFAVSSYIPTLNALAHSTQDTSPSSTIQLLAVPQPPTDGLTRLVFTENEIDHIRTLAARSPFVSIQDSDGALPDVMEKMQSCNWVHFACHGMQDPDDPLDSGLGLADQRRLKLSNIIQLARPRGGLAFLSACQTAQGDTNLAEESVHLAAGMLLAGYGGVIATMWAIRDNDAPQIAKDVYEYLFRDGMVPDSTEAGEALHYAVQRLRDSGASFSSWIPYIHVGK